MPSRPARQPDDRKDVRLISFCAVARVGSDGPPCCCRAKFDCLSRREQQRDPHIVNLVLA
jgi:hypothetical protein